MNQPASQSKPHLEARLSRARQLLDAHRLDAILLTHQADLQWLSDFTGEDSVGILTTNSLVLATDFRFVTQAAQECPTLPLALREGKMPDTLAKVLLDAGTKRVGFESGRTTFATHAGLLKAIDAAGGKVELVPLDGEIVKLRAIKDATEVAILRKAINIAQDALRATLPQARLGMTESDFAGRLYGEMRRLGAGDVSFESIIASGEGAALPHYRAKDRPIQNNTVLLIDYGAKYSGYCSDLTRTFFVGSAPEVLQEAYKHVLESQQRAIAALKPGLRCKDADAVARDYLRSVGFDKEFGHSLGHGVGLDIHEMPRLSKMAEDSEVLLPGMVVTIEPGVYLPGIGGIRIEDDVLITETGHEVLSSLPKSFETAGLKLQT